MSQGCSDLCDEIKKIKNPKKLIGFALNNSELGYYMFALSALDYEPLHQLVP